MKKEQGEFLSSHIIIQPSVGNSEELSNPVTNGIVVSGIVINHGEGQDTIGYKIVDDDSFIVAVADGFGIVSRPNSRQAAYMAIEGMLSHFDKRPAASDERESLKVAIEETQLNVRRALDRWGASSLTSALFSKKGGGWSVNIVSVGDTRCYLVSDEGITQLTRDDDEAGVSNGIGIEPSRFRIPESQTISLLLGTALLLTTDGIHDSIQEDESGKYGTFTKAELAQVIRQTQDPRELASLLTKKSSSDMREDASLVIVRLEA